MSRRQELFFFFYTRIYEVDDLPIQVAEFRQELFLWLAETAYLPPYSIIPKSEQDFCEELARQNPLHQDYERWVEGIQTNNCIERAFLIEYFAEIHHTRLVKDGNQLPPAPIMTPLEEDKPIR
jgi:hypothetical protein